MSTMSPVRVVLACILLYIFAPRGTFASEATKCQAIKPAPKSLDCGTVGRLKNSGSFIGQHTFAGSQTLNDFEQCRDWCLRRVTPPNTQQEYACYAFAFNSKTRLCSFYDKPPRNAIKRDVTSTTAFWDARCFQCPLVCPQGKQNLLDNGGFESSDKYLGPWSTVYDYMYVDGEVVSPGLNSKRAWRCAGEFCNIIQWRSMCPGHLYRFDMDFKIPASNFRSTVYLSVGDQFSGQDFHSDGSQGWRHISYTFRNQYQLETIDIDFYPYNAYSESTYIFVDNVKIVPHRGTIKTLPNSHVEISNGNFEAGRLSPWTFVRYYGKGQHSIVSPGIAPGSEYAYRYESVVSKKNDFDYFRLEHPLPKLELYKNYRMRFYYKLVGIANLNLFVGGMQWQTLEPGGGFGNTNHTIIPPQNETILFERLFTCTETANLFAIDAIKDDTNYGGNGQEILYLDDFSIEEAA